MAAKESLMTLQEPIIKARATAFTFDDGRIDPRACKVIHDTGIGLSLQLQTRADGVRTNAKAVGSVDEKLHAVSYGKQPRRFNADQCSYATNWLIATDGRAIAKLTNVVFSPTPALLLHCDGTARIALHAISQKGDFVRYALDRNGERAVCGSAGA